MIRRQSGLAVHLEVASDLCVAAPQAEALYRIAQEALANVVKHARARRAGVTLAARAGWVGVRIEDDGVGFPPEAREGPPGDAFALRGMRERVQALGGTLRMGNGSTGGAKISALSPSTPAALAGIVVAGANLSGPSAR
jgi:signal transduction histidine kinase